MASSTLLASHRPLRTHRPGSRPQNQSPEELVNQVRDRNLEISSCCEAETGFVDQSGVRMLVI